MKLKFVIPILITIGLILFLNFGASTKSPVDPNTQEQTPESQPTTKVSGNFDIDSLISTLKPKLAPQTQTDISLLENNIARGRDRVQLIADYESLGNIWLKAHFNEIGAYYLGQAGKLDNSTDKLNFAGTTLSQALDDEKTPPMMKGWLQKEAIEFFTSSLAVNPANDTVKIRLANVYMNSDQVMEGVQMLLDVTRRDSTNLPANIMLGKMAIQSGQWDKAIERGNVVLSVDPSSIDARLFMGEAYKQKGNKEKAIQLFSEAKQIMNNASFSKDIDDYIASFK